MNKRIKKFLDDLESVAPKYEWRVRGPTIRVIMDDPFDPPMCPIEATYHAKSGKHVLWTLAGKRMGLEPEDKTLIMRAADCSLSTIKGLKGPTDLTKTATEVRRKMLDILGLEAHE